MKLPEVTLESRPQDSEPAFAPLQGAAVGVLIGFQDDGRTPLVIFAGQPTDGATPARTTQDLHGAHIGADVIMVCEGADPRRPVIIGVLPRSDGATAPRQLLQAEIQVDGDRTVVSAKEQLVLRCGAASITLTRNGKVLIEGAYISQRSAGVMRLKGGSVQLN